MVEILKRGILVTENRTVALTSIKLVCQRGLKGDTCLHFFFPRPTFRGAADKLQKIELKLIQPMGSVSLFHLNNTEKPRAGIMRILNFTAYMKAVNI
jgi:hypothetical protein